MTAILFSLGTLANDIENGVSAWSKYRSSQTLFVRLRMFLNSKCHMIFSNEKFSKSNSPDYLRIISRSFTNFFLHFHINFLHMLSIFKMREKVNLEIWDVGLPCKNKKVELNPFYVRWSIYMHWIELFDLIHKNSLVFL